jgi:hypothetical protein
MELFYGRAGRLTAANGGFRPGQLRGSLVLSLENLQSQLADIQSDIVEVELGSPTLKSLRGDAPGPQHLQRRSPRSSWPALEWVSGLPSVSESGGEQMSFADSQRLRLRERQREQQERRHPGKAHVDRETLAKEPEYQQELELSKVELELEVADAQGECKELEAAEAAAEVAEAVAEAAAAATSAAVDEAAEEVLAAVEVGEEVVVVAHGLLSAEAALGLGRIITLRHRSSTSYQIH